MRTHEVRIEQLEDRLIGLRSSRLQLEQAIQKEKGQHRAVEELLSNIGSTMPTKAAQRRLPDRISKELKAAILSGLSTELSSRSVRSNSDARCRDASRSSMRNSEKATSKQPVSIFSNPSILDEEPRELIVTVGGGLPLAVRLFRDRLSQGEVHPSGYMERFWQQFNLTQLMALPWMLVNTYGFLSQSTYELIDDVESPLNVLSHDEGKIWRLVCGLIATLPSQRDREFALDMCSGDGAWPGVRGALAEYSEFIRRRKEPYFHVE
ncbi:hypothetical protein FOL47_008400 [Perkinsus chesapeaki]|uniref:Uncharacterized protein n=1 Tax=Perkinsus chesapeaki TaxID=330153 RepID=A0A7J6LEC0_PERCH|nr:hypothetical protein FOL47_008400 [Perkinsus chesapeaki]